MDYILSEEFIERPPFVKSDVRIKAAAKLFKSDPSLSVITIIENSHPIGIIHRKDVFERWFDANTRDDTAASLERVIHRPPHICLDATIDIIHHILPRAKAAGGAFIFAISEYRGWMSYDALVDRLLYSAASISADAIHLPPAPESMNDTSALWQQFLSSVKLELTNIRTLTSKLGDEKDTKLSATLVQDVHAALQDLDHQLLGTSYLYPNVAEHDRKFSAQALCEFLIASWAVRDGDPRGRPSIRFSDTDHGVTLPNPNLVRFILEQAVHYLGQTLPGQRQVITLSVDDTALTASIKIRTTSNELKRLAEIIDLVSSPEGQTHTLLIRSGVRLANLAKALKQTGTTTTAPDTYTRVWNFKFPAQRHLITPKGHGRRAGSFKITRALVATPDGACLAEIMPILSEMGWYIDHRSNMVDFGVSVRRHPYQLILCDLDAFGIHEGGLEKIVRFQNPLNQRTPFIGVTQGLRPIIDRSIVPHAIFTRPINKTEFTSSLLDALMDQGRDAILHPTIN